MAADFDGALIEFAANAAAFNARALHAAGLPDDLGLGAMHVYLDFAERHYELDPTEQRRSMVAALREVLPPET